MTLHSEHDLTAHPTPNAPVTVRHGNAFDLLRELPDASVDAVVTDPPYGIATPPGLKALHGRQVTCRTCGDTTAPTWVLCQTCLDIQRDVLLTEPSMLGHVAPNAHTTGTHTRGLADCDPGLLQRWAELLGTQLLRVLKPGGHALLFGAPKTSHRVTTGLENAGFDVRDQITWIHQGAGARSTGILAVQSELIAVVRRPMIGTRAMNHDLFGTGVLNTAGAASLAELPTTPTNVVAGEPGPDVFARAQQMLHDTVAFPPAVVCKKATKGERTFTSGTHPTVKPLALMRYLVELATPPGGTVLDPFAGSGTTVEAAIVQGRPVIAFEADSAYLPLITERITRTAAA
ncbi:DNA (cytosine-5-)-methyltransferase [Aeromicrobium marinum DSM 15272]|uniref:Methyltransferase n=1 Tax=Aeromicrobium marinum DSM 15272 TaxID=585531 RepID=E2S842_9ACTN|nr:DNA methyltransferase [Aeromicrobium marinum]EFQ84347.1 DNA (cytosine-5-)-methyltransferase [Aeromicrobium marinum DSM 15272]